MSKYVKFSSDYRNMSQRDRASARAAYAQQAARASMMLGRSAASVAARRMGRINVPRPLSQPAAFVGQGPEIKAIDIAQNVRSYRLPATNTVMLLNGVQTGAAFFNRVGSRIEMKNLHIRGSIINAATSTITSILRMIIVYDRQPTGALPAVTDILQSRDQTGTATNSGVSEINLDERDRYAILRDYQVYGPPVTNTGGTLTAGPQFPPGDDSSDVNIFIKLKGLTTHFKSSSNPTTIADIATGALYALFVTDVSDNTWQANVGFRLRYMDR